MKRKEKKIPKPCRGYEPISDGNLTGKQKCFFCPNTYDLDPHHALCGSGIRPSADYLGLIVPLCRKCHNKAHFIDNDMLIKIKIYAVNEFLKAYTREDFKKIFGREIEYYVENKEG